LYQPPSAVKGKALEGESWAVNERLQRNRRAILFALDCARHPAGFATLAAWSSAALSANQKSMTKDLVILRAMCLVSAMLIIFLAKTVGCWM
jgi:hypothetical protein